MSQAFDEFEAEYVRLHKIFEKSLGRIENLSNMLREEEKEAHEAAKAIHRHTLSFPKLMPFPVDPNVQQYVHLIRGD